MYPVLSKRRGRKSQRNRETRETDDQSSQVPLEQRTDIASLTHEPVSCTPAQRLSDCIVQPTLLPDAAAFSPGGDLRVGEEATGSDRTAPVLFNGHTGTRTRYFANVSEPLNTLSRSNGNGRQMRSTRQETTDSSEPPLPPRALGLALLEIYFSRVYNASLLFQKRVVFQDYLKGDLPVVLVKAIFALATLYAITYMV